MSGNGVRLQGVILHVSSMAESIDFYARLLDLEVARRSDEAAVLAGSAGACTIAMRESRRERFVDNPVQALVWHVSSLEALADLEQRLEKLDARPVRRALAEEAITVLTARDPEGQRVIFVHHEGESDVPRGIPAEVFWY